MNMPQDIPVVAETMVVEVEAVVMLLLLRL
jgi:hypothetical protein